MYTLVLKEKVEVFESWEELQDYLHKRWVVDRSAKRGKKSKAKSDEDLIYKIETKKSFTVKFDEEDYIPT